MNCCRALPEVRLRMVPNGGPVGDLCSEDVASGLCGWCIPDLDRYIETCSVPRTRPVQDGRGDEGGIWNDCDGAVIVDDLGRPNPHTLHGTFGAGHGHPVAELDRALEQEEYASYEDLNDRLKSEPDPNCKRAGDERDLFQRKTEG